MKYYIYIEDTYGRILINESNRGTFVGTANSYEEAVRLRRKALKQYV